jgi:hypothetical protein
MEDVNMVVMLSSRPVSIDRGPAGDVLTVEIGSSKLTLSDQEMFDLIFAYKSMRRTARVKGAISKPRSGKRDIPPGTVFGSLTTIEYSHTERRDAGHSDRYMRCICECGIEAIIRADRLRSGKAKSCGCRSMAKVTPVGL